MSDGNLATLSHGPAQWWLEPEGDKHAALCGVVRQIRTAQEYRKTNDLLNASMYGNTQMLGFGLSTYVRQDALASRSRLSLNVIKNVIDTVTSKIAAKNLPKPTFLTEGGNYEQRRRAQKLEKFVEGVFYETRFYADLPKMFRDACIFGTGFAKVSDADKRIDIERIMPWEVIVDDGEALYGAPQNLYQRKYYDRRVAMRVFGKDDAEKEAKIAGASHDTEDAEYAYNTTADQVLITEGWHLGEDIETPGRHAIAIDTCTLVDDECDVLPIPALRWADAIVGFFGQGLAEELCGIQVEINKLLREIQHGHHLIKGHYIVAEGSRVTTNHLNNDLGSIIKYAGIAPTYVPPSIISPEIYQHLWALYAKAFEICGVSQMSATGQKPAGLNSGAAQRTYQEVQSERFLHVGHMYEEFVLEVARLVVSTARRIAKRGGYKVKARSKNMIETIDWKDVDLREDEYIMKVYPTSLLPTTPAGRLAWAQDMINSGIIPPGDVLGIIDFPDTEEYTKRANAARNVIEQNIASILADPGEYMPPEPYDNHALALKLVSEAYDNARIERAPEEKLALLRNYMTATKAEIDRLKAANASPPPTPAMPAPPPGPPMQGPPPAMPPPAPMPPPPMAA